MSLSVTSGTGPAAGSQGWAGVNIPAAYSLSQQLLSAPRLNNPTGLFPSGSSSTGSSSYTVPNFPSYSSTALPTTTVSYGVNVNLFWSGLQKQSNI